ncbi:MAG: DUF4242 domain-containing protein [Kocuria sp.]|nr:DUF4242 domain-containing protein [Kocuria sp.]
MPLFLVELAPSTTDKSAVAQLLETVSTALSSTGAELIESQVTAGHERVFVILEATSPDGVFNSVKEAVGNIDVDGPHEVRLVGAELDDIKKLKKSAEYLVEWDIPAEITMDQYLTRKKANAPKYAEVPEVQFLRTYVREDTAKCLCFYDAPDEDAVVRAREAVSTPIDRMHKLEA